MLVYLFVPYFLGLALDTKSLPICGPLLEFPPTKKTQNPIQRSPETWTIPESAQKKRRTVPWQPRGALVWPLSFATLNCTGHNPEPEPNLCRRPSLLGELNLCHMPRQNQTILTPSHALWPQLGLGRAWPSVKPRLVGMTGRFKLGQLMSCPVE